MASTDRDVLPDSYVTLRCNTKLILLSDRFIDRVKPINYAISIFDIELGGGYSYHGTVKIEIDIKQSTDEIVLNTHELKIKSASVQSAQSKCQFTVRPLLS